MQNAIVSPGRQEVLRRFVLLGTPLTLGILELGHPLLDHTNPIKMLVPIATWWIVLHVLLIPLFVLMGWALFLLIRDINSPAATISRYAAVLYTAFAIAYDSGVGLNLGIVASNASTLPNEQQNIILQTIHQFFFNPAIILTDSLVLTTGAVAICSAAWALSRAGAPSLPLLVLLGALLATYSHARPFGPLGEACFFLAALWLELAWRKLPSKVNEAMPISLSPDVDGRRTAEVSSKE